MPDILVKETARPAPALSATSDTPEAWRKATQQPSDFAALKEPPARSTATADTDSSPSPSTAEEDADIDDAIAHETLVSAIGEYSTAVSSAPKVETVTTAFLRPQPKRDEFADYADYETALTSWTVAKASHEAISSFSRENAEKQAAEQRQKKIVDSAGKIVQSWSARCAAAAKRYPDFAEKTTKDDLSITPTMRDVIMTRKDGPDLAYALATNPKEASRIAALPLLDQAVELGKFAATVKPAQQPRARARSASSSKGETMEQYAARRNKEIQAQRDARGGVFRK